MADQQKQQTALGDVAARQLAIATRTVPQMGTITPTLANPSFALGASGIWRVPPEQSKGCKANRGGLLARDERELPSTFVDYIENPREYNLAAVQTIVDVHTRVSDLYSKPYNQISEQLRLAIETSRNVKKVN